MLPHNHTVKCHKDHGIGKRIVQQFSQRIVPGMKNNRPYPGIYGNLEKGSLITTYLHHQILETVLIIDFLEGQSLKEFEQMSCIITAENRCQILQHGLSGLTSRRNFRSQRKCATKLKNENSTEAGSWRPKIRTNGHWKLEEIFIINK